MLGRLATRPEEAWEGDGDLAIVKRERRGWGGVRHQGWLALCSRLHLLHGDVADFLAGGKEGCERAGKRLVSLPREIGNDILQAHKAVVHLLIHHVHASLRSAEEMVGDVGRV